MNFVLAKTDRFLGKMKSAWEKPISFSENQLLFGENRSGFVETPWGFAQNPSPSY